MRHNWTRIGFGFIAIAMLLTVACGGSSTTQLSNAGVIDAKKTYTVNFWEAFATGANKDALNYLVQQYEAKHPNVTINLQAYPDYTTLKTKITAAIASGTPPTMAQVYEEWAVQFQNANALTPMDQFIGGANGLSSKDINDFYPSIWKDGQINGKQYMMPFNKSLIVLYYNADMLQQLGLTIPTTWDQLATDIQQATKADGSQWGLSYTPSPDEWSILYKAFGGTDFVSSDGKSATFGSGSNATAAKQAIDYFAQLAKTGAIHVTKGYAWQNDLASQKSLFAISSVASYPFIETAIANKYQLGEAPLPAGPSGQFTTLFGTNVSIFSGASSDSQNAAWDFLKYLTSVDANAYFVQKTGYMPIRQSVYNSSALQSYYSQVPARKVGPDSLKYGFVPSIYPAWDSCRNIITTSVTAALNGQQDSATAVSTMAQQCTAQLAQG